MSDPDNWNMGGRSRDPRRGPYGTNEGDMWGHRASGSPVQERLNADGEGLVMVTEVFRGESGELEERIYSTADEQLVAEAGAGWIARQRDEARRN